MSNMLLENLETDIYVACTSWTLMSLEFELPIKYKSIKALTIV